MSYEHNHLKNLFLSDSFANALFQTVLEREQYDEPKFADKVLKKVWKRKEQETEHDLNDIYTTIEYDEWDIGIETERCLCVYTSKCKDFYKKYGDVHSQDGITFCTEDDPNEIVITQDVGRGEGLTLFVDVCPRLGEEYPHILRDIERKIPQDDDETHKYVLVVDECSVQSCEWEDLVDIFDRHDIALISFKELMQ